MTYADQLKRRLVRAAVRENVDAIMARSPRALRRGRRVGRALLSVYRLGLAPALLFLAIAVLSTGGSDWRGPSPRTESLGALAARIADAVPRSVHVAAFPLGVKRIVLDPGHGGQDPGARAASGALEKEITLDVARRLRALLRESSFDVVLTREGDETVTLRERVLIANAAGGDLFVSIHVNALPTPEQCGLETYYLGPTEDPHIQRLTGSENRESGYSLGDLRQLLDGLYAHIRQRESRQFAEAVQQGLVTFLRRRSEVKNNGVKTAPFLVLGGSEMPGVLTELSCLSNDEQAHGLSNPAHRQNIARGLFVGIRAYADARNTLSKRGSL